MISVNHAKPTAKKLLNHVEVFEAFCMGEQALSPTQFREINEELSIGAVLMLGKYRHQKSQDGHHLLWSGLDGREHDLGLVENANITRDYPGFHAKRTLSLGNNLVSETQIIASPNGRKNLSKITMEDGSIGIAPNYRMALRNAAIKMHLSNKFNYFSLSHLWNKVWGHA